MLIDRVQIELHRTVGGELMLKLITTDSILEGSPPRAWPMDLRASRNEALAEATIAVWNLLSRF